MVVSKFELEGVCSLVSECNSEEEVIKNAKLYY